MSTTNFWATFVPAEVKESRFGLIPQGEHLVTIVDLMPIRASQNFRLDDNAKITGIVQKDASKFDMAFDQDILALVYRNNEGQVLIDRRSSIGWLTNDEKLATPEMIQKHGLVSVGKRFTKNGIGVASKRDADQKPDDKSIGGKTRSCIDMGNRLFQACGVSGIDELVGKSMKIIVESKRNGEKISNEVKSYLPANHVSSTTASAPKPVANKPAPKDDDDLPF